LHVLASPQASQGLAGVHLGRCTQDHGIDFFQSQGLVQVGGDMTNAVFVSHLFGFSELAPDQGDDFNAVNIFDAVQVFDTEGTSASKGDFDGFAHE
jgi:hypothetical protein